MNEVSVVNLVEQSAEERKEIKKIVLKILKILKQNNVSVEIYLADAKKMRFLNKKFRGKNKAASILSFEEPKNFILPPSKTRKIGEIYLNAEFSIFNFQFSILLAHGLLHLLGYTHEKKSDTIEMEKMEKFLISNLCT